MVTAKHLISILFIAATLQLTGCQADSAQRPSPDRVPHAKEGSVMRTTVPLVRPLSPQVLSDVITLDFAVSAQADDPEPPIFIGMRVTARDAEAALSQVERLRDAGVTAQVHLYRLTAAGEEPVVLQRSELVGRTEYQSVALDRDGHVPGLLKANADEPTMRVAGLIAPGAAYREMDLAFVRDTQPGQYRVTVRFEGNVRSLEQANPELLVAFTAKAK
ncbi:MULTISPECIES: hypothetical protein [Xanthomonas]|uniref:hypothetical protein n=1 Tax=Xanthomonas TaxID=338 RepID=UPI001FD22907|nr:MULTISPECIES: hypothetical protein [unclassified Xanthomonas]WNH44547.1 hypothetical protein PG878_18865 [Xanthomonas sp. A6251]